MVHKNSNLRVASLVVGGAVRMKTALPLRGPITPDSGVSRVQTGSAGAPSLEICAYFT